MGAALPFSTLMEWAAFLDLEQSPPRLAPMSEPEQASALQALAAAGVGKWQHGT